MAKLLIQFAHPVLEKSRIHQQLIREAASLGTVTINDLYEVYPTMHIDVEREKQLLLAHDIIIFQFPFFWYSSPAVLKQWLDLVLEHGWAYGKNGNALQGKKMMVAISCGASLHAYTPEGHNRYSVREFLRPYEQTAALCKMEFLPPFVMYGGFHLTAQNIHDSAIQYKELLRAFTVDAIDTGSLTALQEINQLFPILPTTL